MQGSSKKAPKTSSASARKAKKGEILALDMVSTDTCLPITYFISMAYAWARGQTFCNCARTPYGRPYCRVPKCPSTSVPLRFESILYPESYCGLARPQIHFGFGQEACLDGF